MSRIWRRPLPRPGDGLVSDSPVSARSSPGGFLPRNLMGSLGRNVVFGLGDNLIRSLVGSPGSSEAGNPALSEGRSRGLRRPGRPRGSRERNPARNSESSLGSCLPRSFQSRSRRHIAGHRPPAGQGASPQFDWLLAPGPSASWCRSPWPSTIGCRALGRKAPKGAKPVGAGRPSAVGAKGVI